MVQKVFTVPFAQNGSRTAIPDASQPGGEVSYAVGFGPDYERQLGVDPLAKNIERENFNQTLFDATTSLQEFQAGLGTVPFNAALAAALTPAGYPKGATIPRADGSGYWVSTAASNSTDPAAGGSWVPASVNGTFTQALTSVNVTPSVSNAAFPVLILTGVLTANVQVILPVWAGYSWTVDNRCTGAFTVSVLTAAGTPVVAPTGATTPIYCDGVNIKLSVASATETVAGIAKVATQVQVAAGLDDSTMVTPKKLLATQATTTLLGLVQLATSAQMQVGTSPSLVPSVAAVMSLLSKRVFAANDFIRIPDVVGGLIIQFGTATLYTSGMTAVTFPTPFTTAPRSISAISSGATYVYAGGFIGLTGVNLAVGTGSAIPCNWIAIGY